MNSLLYTCSLLLILFGGTAGHSTKKHAAPQHEQNQTPKIKVSGSITQSGCYWGGVVPSPEMLKQIETPHPYPHLTLFVKEGSSNTPAQPVYQSFQTDDSGKFELLLPAEKSWIIVEDWQCKPITYPSEAYYINVDKACIQAHYAKPLIYIKASTMNVQLEPVNIAHPCPSNVPCMQYIGPTPP
jgi:hypothetical protein